MQPGIASHPRAAAASVLVLGLTCTLLAGCTIDKRKQGDGENVKIATPFGGMSVKTDEAVVEAGTGLPPYPGAQIVKTDGDNHHEKAAADVNMNFGGFQLRVNVVNYRTPDAPAKVLDFYRKGLARYGTVIQCTNYRPVGTPTRTSEGLDCSDDGKVNAGFSGKTELRAGSKQHRHIVSLEPESDAGGTQFALVAVDLPSHLIFSDEDGDGKNRKSE